MPAKRISSQLHRGTGRSTPVSTRSQRLKIPRFKKEEIYIQDVQLLAHRYKELCALQSKLEQAAELDEFDCKKKMCISCGAIRFENCEFFMPLGADFSRVCLICIEVSTMLEKAGFNGKQINGYLDKSFVSTPKHEHGELEEIFQKNRAKGCMAEKTMCCQHCRSKWPSSRQYFHTKKVDGEEIVINICLACPGERRFFYTKR